MQLLLSRAGLVLNPGQVADLVLAWRQVAGLIASIPHDRPLADDMAYVFRLPPPLMSVPKAAPAKAPGKSKAAAPRAKAKAAAPKRKAKGTAAAKRNAARPAGRKRVRRGR
jgi:hypothetical protein